MLSENHHIPDSPASLTVLFGEFAKVGLFTFGGGYAMIPIIESLCVVQYRWLTPEQMGQTIVIAESTPGPIAVNCATYVGYLQRRWLGALAATAGICLPSFIIIYFIALWFQNFLSYKPVVHALAGINIAVGLLVLQAGLKMARQQRTPLGLTIVALALTALILGELHILPLTCTAIMGGAVIMSLGHYTVSGQAATERIATDQGETATSDPGETAASDPGETTTSDPGETTTSDPGEIAHSDPGETKRRKET